MNSQRWQQIEAVLQEALDRAPQDRAFYLDSVCSDDEELKKEATSLVEAYEEAGEFIEEPAICRDARVLAGDLPDLNIGRLLGGYKILKQLGSGGMGQVYLGEDLRLARLVALKILPTYLVIDENRLHRFQREARAASTLNHPNILTIHEVGEADGVHFIATEFIDGQTIRELLNQGDLSLEEILDICIQVGSGLVSAHTAGIVHRDIKPENIMRRHDGLVKVLDFGIAKLMEPLNEGTLNSREHRVTQTETGVVLGTVGYMSPEQARGLTVDERTDVWSFGVVLYEMLAKREPFAGETRMDILVSILEHAPKSLFELRDDSPEPFRRLQEILDRSLCKEKEGRYQNVAEMLSDLKRLKQELEVATLFNDSAARSLIAAAKTTEKPVRNASTHDASLDEAIAPSRRHLFLITAASVLVVALFAAFLLQRQLVAELGLGSNVATSKLYRDMSDAERLAFIAQQEQRISAMMGDRPVKLNDEALAAIKKRVDYYTFRLGSVSDKAGNENLQQIYERATPLVPFIARSFEARKVPATIGIYLPMIEAAYRPCAESPLGAKGLFQMLPQTAKGYGVQPEEMCDIEKMTPAAAEYVADRMAELGEDSQSMTLVLLSYNRGAPSVLNALVQLRSVENFERNFWTLFAHRDRLDESFRNESAGYVPMFFAAAIIGENPQVFGLTTPPLSSLASGQSAQSR